MDLSYVGQKLETHGYKTVKKLGEGAQAEVYLVEIDGKKYASKVFTYEVTKGLGADLIVGSSGDGLGDIHYSMLFKHPYIVETYDLIRDDAKDKTEHNCFFTIMDAADEDLYNYLMSTTISLEQKLKLMYQIGTALDYISSLGYAHCDLNVGNILMKGENALVADFGLVLPKDFPEYEFCNAAFLRAPEAIDVDEYNNLFPEHKRKLWAMDMTRTELWTYGLLCLNILYNDPGNTHEKVLGNKLNGTSLAKSVEKQNPYHRFIATLVKYRDQYTTSQILQDIFGKLDNDEERRVLDVIASCLLDLDQDKRLKTYTEFLNNGIFRDYLVPGLDSFAHFPLAAPLTLSKGSVYTSKMLDITTEWIFDVLDEFMSYAFITFNAVDFFLQKAPKYIAGRRDVQLFAIATIWIYFKIFRQYDTATLETCSYITNYAYNEREILNMILNIIEKEKGIFKIDSIYDYLPTLESLAVAVYIMKDCERYNKLGGARGTALYIIKHPVMNNDIIGKTPKRDYMRWLELKDKEEFGEIASEE